MATYYLQQWEKDGREIIDVTFPLDAFRVKESRDSDCWIGAKKAFGYELSEEQNRLLAKLRGK